MSYFLAVDAGGSKTEFLLANEDRELHRVVSGSVKRLNASETEAAAQLDDALSRLAKQAGISMNQIARTCIGTSGNTVPLVVDWLRNNFSRRVSGSLLILGDVEIALDAAFPGARGVLVLAGTGSNVAGRGQDGKIMTAGGWGPMLADQCAGFWIGLEGLRRGFLAVDESRPSKLLEMARELWGLPSVESLIEFANSEPRPLFSEFAPMVVQCAEDGDEVSCEILDRGAADLAYLAQLVIDRILKSENRQLLPPSIATAGSILGKVRRIRDAVVSRLQNRYTNLQFVEPADPVKGALYRARMGA
ncbi:MAG TPA: BadF/BadG/BcrA/BcrD ATPase family protein [Terracidiphilus sp.]|nr:BadF/BadG/BcrA/BcrD ATPase family protein [Terracidiphilus sp.]